MPSRQIFAVTWDYRWPFARIAHEHVLDALQEGGPWDVTFVPFFLNQSHVPEGGVPAWDDPAQQPDLVALASGVVVRDRIPERFHEAHRALFTARHGEAGDPRAPAVVADARTRAGVAAEAALAEVDSGWPAKQIRSEHEDAVSRLDVFGVPTFIVGDHAVFVRLMARPEGNADLARTTIDRVLALITDHPDLNEFKHTRLVG